MYKLNCFHGKVIRRKGDKLYIKWKGYNNSFNSWLDKASLVQRT